VLRGRGFSMRAHGFMCGDRVETKSKKRQPTGAFSGGRLSSMYEENTIDYCRECKGTLIEIDNRGELLRGCMTCNIWWSRSGEKVRLSEEDLRSLHLMRRRPGYR
jgi:hypothetical protein